MVIDFDFDRVTNIEFGVGRENEDQSQQFFEAVPVDEGVQKALVEMVQTTIVIMRKNNDKPELY